jgi:hypothetical protein
MIWYIEPLDAHTNEVISRMIEEENISFDTKLCEDSENKKRKRNLWKCDHSFVARCKRDKVSLRLNFNMFNQEKNGSPIRQWLFEQRKRVFKHLPATATAPA